MPCQPPDPSLQTQRMLVDVIPAPIERQVGHSLQCKPRGRSPCSSCEVRMVASPLCSLCPVSTAPRRARGHPHWLEVWTRPGGKGSIEACLQPSQAGSPCRREKAQKLLGDGRKRTYLHKTHFSVHELSFFFFYSAYR